MKELLRGGNLAHAHAVVVALEAAGIRAYIRGELGGAYLEGGIAVYIAHDDELEPAHAVLAELEGPTL